MAELVGVFPPSIEQDPIRRALDCLEEGFQIIGFDWRYVYLNPAAARHGRRRPSELIGRSILDEYPGFATTPVYVKLRRSMEERIPQVFENEFTFPDGARRWFELRVQPVPEGICVYSTDVTSRKHGASLLERLRSILGRQWGAGV